MNGDSHDASSEVRVGTDSFAVLNAASTGRYTVSVVKDTGDVYAWWTDEDAVALLVTWAAARDAMRADELLYG